MSNIDLNISTPELHSLRNPDTSAVRVKAGEYLFNGHLIERALDEDCNPTSEWTISENTAAGWRPVDMLGTLRDCKAMILRWVTA